MARPHAIRKPREYTARAPGDLIQIDTMELRPVPGTILKHFTAHDVVSRYNLAMVRSRATATTARDFLSYLQQAFPVPIQAIQVDGGSEFMAEFEAACAHDNIRVFLLPPRSPKLNRGVERAHLTHRDEFYECCRRSQPSASGARLSDASRLARLVAGSPSTAGDRLVEGSVSATFQTSTRS
jgi:putative transposase